MDASEVQAIYVAGVEAGYVYCGERHGYAGVLHGLTAVLKAGGLETDWRELAALYHDPLSDYHNQPETHAVASIAARVDAVLARDARIAIERGAGYERQYLGGGYGFTIGLEGHAAEVQAKLRVDRIRRGTARHKALIAEHAARVVACCTDYVAARLAARAQQDDASAKRLEQEADGLAGVIARWQRRLAVVQTLAGAGGAAGVPAATPLVAGVVERYTARAATARQAAASWRLAAGGRDPRAIAREHMRRSDDLRPFLEYVEQSEAASTSNGEVK